MEHGLPHQTINDLLETRRGVYWIATNGAGVCRFDPHAPLAGTKGVDGRPALQGAGDQMFTVYPVGEEPRTNNVNVLYEDRRGQLWAGTDAGLFRLEATNGQEVFRNIKVALTPQPDRPLGVLAFLEDREGNLWIGTDQGLVRRFPDGGMISYAVQPSWSFDQVTALLEDREGRLWVGHQRGGLLQVEISDSGWGTGESGRNRGRTFHPQSTIQKGGRAYTTADGLADNRVQSLYQTSDGRIWVATNHGLTELHNGRLHSHTTKEGLGDNFLRALAEDRDGNLWIGSQSGAMKLTLNGFTTYDEADGLAHTQIHSLYESERGEFFVVSGDWFINRFDGTRFTSVQVRLPGEAQYGWTSPAGFLDRAGDWWMLTNKGLCRFAKVSSIEQLAHQRPQAVYTSRDGLAGDFIYQLFEDSRGDMWITTRSGPQNGGLSRWQRATGRIFSYSEADGFSSTNLATAFCEDGSGNLWIGFNFGGLARYAAGRFTWFGTADGLPAGLISALHLDQAGQLWITTGQSGIGRIDDPKAERPRFTTFTTADGLSSNNVRCVTADRWGDIYVGTARGVDRFNPETRRFKHYSTADGLSSDFVTTALRDQRGWLWFGTMRGLSRLIPKPERPHAPSILIGGLRAGGVARPVSQLGEMEISGLELPPDQNQLQIDFFGLGFAMGELLRYQFKLEGGGQDWSASSDQRTVNYPYLPPGEYRFLVRAVSADGTTSTRPAAVAFRILPPIWQRWWFLTLAALFAGLIAYSAHRYRLARLLELERVRTRIAADLHDDIGSSLSQVAILSEVARQQVGEDEASVTKPLSMISRIALESMDAMSDIVWAINPRKDHLQDLAQRMRRLASDAFTARDVKFRFRAPEEMQEMRIGPDMRRQVFLIFKESVNNIIRHSSCTEANVELRLEKRWLILNVSDNGKGFDPERVSQGNGLANIRERARKMRGRLEIVSDTGRSTTLTLKIPV